MSTPKPAIHTLSQSAYHHHSNASISTPKPAPHTLSQFVCSPPAPSPGNPSVVPVLQPADWRHQVERSERPPTPTQLPQHPVDPCRALEPSPTLFEHPGRPIRLLPGHAQRFDQSRLLVGACRDPPAAIVPFDPPRKSGTELAIAVIDEGQPVVAHGPKLHCRG